MKFSDKTSFSALLKRTEIGILGGAHDALSARLVEEAGFDGVWASSFGMSLSSRCIPDADLLTLTETLDIVRNMVAAVQIPVVADCNAGFGSAVNVIHMTRDFERAGASGICIEDNCYPKRCSLYQRAQRELVPIDEMAGKIRAAVEARSDPSLAVIARVEALIAKLGVDNALERASAYVEAGADALVVHSTTIEILEEFLDRWDLDCPMIVIPTLFDHVGLAHLAKLGYRIAIFPNQAVRAAIRAMRDALRRIIETGNGAAVSEDIAPLSEVYELVRLDHLEEAEWRYSPAAVGPAGPPRALTEESRLRRLQ
jgi:phosphoenolpyruvate phosphomutase